MLLCAGCICIVHYRCEHMTSTASDFIPTGGQLCILIMTFLICRSDSVGACVLSFEKTQIVLDVLGFCAAATEENR